MAGPGDGLKAAGRGHLRASHADRDQVIGTLNIEVGGPEWVPVVNRIKDTLASIGTVTTLRQTVDAVAGALDGVGSMSLSCRPLTVSSKRSAHRNGSPFRSARRRAFSPQWLSISLWKGPPKRPSNESRRSG